MMMEPRADRTAPVRMCAVCRRRLPKAELDRFVSRPGTGGPIPDPGQRLEGRGIYRCRDNDCREHSRSSIFERKPKGVSA